jgi:hypothetical protein
MMMTGDDLNQWLYFGITLAILASGTIALWLQFMLMRRMEASPNDLMRISIVTLIVTFGLATAAMKSAAELKELAPIFGLFGTVAGYLLGSSHGQRSSSKTAPPPVEPAPKATGEQDLRRSIDISR